MNILLKKEEILYQSVVDTQNIDSSAAIYDYASYIFGEGATLINHTSSSVGKRNKEEEKFNSLYKKINAYIKKDLKSLSKLIKELNLENNEIIKENLSNLNNFTKGKYYDHYLFIFDWNELEFLDILKYLDESGYRKKILKYSILSKGKNKYIKGVKAFEDKEKYYELRKAFDKKHAITTTGALARMRHFLNNMNDKNLDNSYIKKISIIDVDKIHKSIILSDIDYQNSSKTVLYMKGNDIYHYRKGKLIYKRVGLRDPLYIAILKCVIRYMPEDITKIRISDFEKNVDKDDLISIKGSSYRHALSSNKSLEKTFGKNNFKNINPSTGEKLIHSGGTFIIFNNKL